MIRPYKTIQIRSKDHKIATIEGTRRQNAKKYDVGTNRDNTTRKYMKIDISNEVLYYVFIIYNKYYDHRMIRVRDDDIFHPIEEVCLESMMMDDEKIFMTILP